MTLPMTMLSILAAADPIDHVKRHFVFQLGPIEVTNQMIMALVAAILMIFIFPTIYGTPSSVLITCLAAFFGLRRRSGEPKGTQQRKHEMNKDEG